MILSCLLLACLVTEMVSCSVYVPTISRQGVTNQFLMLNIAILNEICKHSESQVKSNESYADRIFLPSPIFKFHHHFKYLDFSYICTISGNFYVHEYTWSLLLKCSCQCTPIKTYTGSSTYICRIKNSVESSFQISGVIRSCYVPMIVNKTAAMS